MINLLPPSIKEERRYGRINRVLIAWSIAVICLGLICAAIIVFSYEMVRKDSSSVQKEIVTNQEEIGRLEEAQKQIDETAKQLATIKKLYGNEVKFSEIIPKIGGMIPPGAILTSLSLTGSIDEPLQLSFKLKNQELASALKENLANSDLFASADILSVTNESSGTVSDYGFATSIVVSFEGAKPKTAAPAKSGGS